MGDGQTMKAYRADRLGGLDALGLVEVEAPEPGPGQARIAVRAAGLHLADVAALAGQRQPRIAPPFVPGFEVSGVVSALGSGTAGLAIGQPVIAFLPSGGLAEEAVAEIALCVPLPEGLAFGRAAGLPLAYGGALMALRDRAGLAAGETLLVLGAGGQAGLSAIEIGKYLGANVIAAAGQAARLEAALEQGADHSIDSAATPLGEAVLALTEGRGADVLFDPVGGDASAAALAALAPGARMLCTGFAAGKAPALNAQALYARDAALITVNVPLMVARQPEHARQALGDVAGWAAAGEIRPRVAAQFVFEEARHAFDYVMARRGSGAVVVTMSGTV